MKKAFLSILVLFGLASPAYAYEEPSYTVLQKFSASIELRRYDSFVVAETITTGTREDAANAAFRPLFRFISEQNIPMTIPVTQQMNDAGTWVVAFVMPPDKTLANIPNPSDQKITLRTIPAYSALVYRFSGFVTDEKVASHRKTLEVTAAQSGKTLIGAPVVAYYNSPFALPFMRRNEIIWAIKD